MRFLILAAVLATACTERAPDAGRPTKVDRSYVLDNSRIKDLRTNVEISNTRAVLDGDLDEFISASLKQGV